jgi:hypothetical protein
MNGWRQFEGQVLKWIGFEQPQRLHRWAIRFWIFGTIWVIASFALVAMLGQGFADRFGRLIEFGFFAVAIPFGVIGLYLYWQDRRHDS